MDEDNDEYRKWNDDFDDSHISGSQQWSMTSPSVRLVTQALLSLFCRLSTHHRHHCIVMFMPPIMCNHANFILIKVSCIIWLFNHTERKTKRHSLYLNLCWIQQPHVLDNDISRNFLFNCPPLESGQQFSDNLHWQCKKARFMAWALLPFSLIYTLLIAVTGPVHIVLIWKGSHMIQQKD